MNKSGFLNSKKIAAVLAVASIFTGFFLLDQGTTGNVVINGSAPIIDTGSIIGLVLVFCSAILAFYSVRK